MTVSSLAWMVGSDVLYPALVPESLLRATLSIVLLSTLAAVYPAFSAGRLEPREALFWTLSDAQPAVLRILNRYEALEWDRAFIVLREAEDALRHLEERA